MADEPAGRLTYRNPVLNADWPDPDVIRVGETYYLVTSSFNRAPGLPVLRSPDLLRWELIGRALPAVPPAEHFTVPRHGGGAWAPSIRHHDGLFWIFYPDPDHGVHVLTATDPAGPWSAPHLLLPGPGVIDPCPLWDDDGRAWLVFGWAKSRSGISNRLSLVEMTPDAREIIGTPVTVIDGDALPGYSTLEGPKVYKRDGWYWIFAPAGGVATGWQSVFRSRSLAGPYEDRVVLEQGDTPVNGPHQGAWVTTPEGEDWFLHFQDRGVFGRVVHLQPMRWGDDGWPVMGVDGHPVLEHPAPARASAAVLHSAPALGPHPAPARASALDLRPASARASALDPRPAPARASALDPRPAGSGQVEPGRDDDFRAGELGPQWHWQANPAPGLLRLDGDGHARLRAVPNDEGNLRNLPQVLGQQVPGVAARFTTTLQLAADEPGTRAGVVVLGASYAYVGLARDRDGLSVEVRTYQDGDEGEVTRFSARLPDETAIVGLRIDSDGAGVCVLRFRHRGGNGGADESGAGDGWVTGFEGFQAEQGRWISAELGLFAAAPPGSPGEGTAVFGPVTIHPRAR
ncbi:family 43 glycosylhydrolase [Nonomuraea sp. NPDC048901]|uniref:glycoside hydrolase family 43 protein n=1 Tax=Nonomuraea sp. NPDC048901 TaxID=3155627 RepID=UPI0034038A85